MDKISRSKKIAIATGIIVIVAAGIIWYYYRKPKTEHLETTTYTNTIEVPEQPLTPPIVIRPPVDIKPVDPAPENIKSMASSIVPKAEEHAMEMQQRDVPIKPTFFDSGSGVMMSGGELTPKELLSPWYQTYTGDVKNHFLLDDGGNGSNGLHFNLCSKACCSDQYPTPFKLPYEDKVCNNKQKFVPSPYMCNNAWQDSGCVCLSKSQGEFIGSRGGNA